MRTDLFVLQPEPGVAGRTVMSKEARLFFNCVIATGLVMLVDGLVPWRFVDLPRFLTYLSLAIIFSFSRIPLPGGARSVSLTFVIVLLAVVKLSLAEALVLGCAAVLVQSLWSKVERPALTRLLFNAGATAIGIVVSYDLSRLAFVDRLQSAWAGAAVASAGFLVVDVGLIAAAMSILEGWPLREVLGSWLRWSGLYHLLGTAAAGLALYLDRIVNWAPAMVVVAPVFFVYSCYRRQLEDKARF